MGPIFPLLSGLLLNKLDSEELEEDFDNPSCQSPSRQFYFFLVLFHSRQPPLSLRWMSWVPPPQHRLLPSHPGAAAFGGPTCWSSGEETTHAAESERRGPHSSHGTSWSCSLELLDIWTESCPRNCQQTLQSNLEWEPSMPPMLESKNQHLSHRIQLFKWLWRRVTTKTKCTGFLPSNYQSHKISKHFGKI